MLRIKVSTFPQSTIIRQTPQEKGIWKEAAFFVNTDIVECDAWVVHEVVSRQESAVCPPSNVILITGEPDLSVLLPAAGRDTIMLQKPLSTDSLHGALTRAVAVANEAALG